MRNKSRTNECSYKKYKNMLNKVITHAKSNYISDKIADDKTNKQLWDEIKSILGKNKEKLHLQELKIEDKIIKDNKEIANEMREYFSSIGEKMNSELPHSQIYNYKRYMNFNAKNSITNNN